MVTTSPSSRQGKKTSPAAGGKLAPPFGHSRGRHRNSRKGRRGRIAVTAVRRVCVCRTRLVLGILVLVPRGARISAAAAIGQAAVSVILVLLRRRCRWSEWSRAASWRRSAGRQPLPLGEWRRPRSSSIPLLLLLLYNSFRCGPSNARNRRVKELVETRRQRVVISEAAGGQQVPSRRRGCCCGTTTDSAGFFLGPADAPCWLANAAARG